MLSPVIVLVAVAICTIHLCLGLRLGVLLERKRHLQASDTGTSGGAEPVAQALAALASKLDQEVKDVDAIRQQLEDLVASIAKEPTPTVQADDVLPLTEPEAESLVVEANQTYRGLVVDDDLPVALATVRALKARGITCELALNGREALDLIEQTQYDVVVTDLKMPVLNGHALAVELLTLEPRPLVVVLTGMHEPRLTDDLTTRGVDRTYFKPVDLCVFSADVRNLLNLKARFPPAPLAHDKAHIAVEA